MVIPPDRISSDTLKSIAEEYVSREATDYGYIEQAFEDKVSSLLASIHSGEALVFFDAASESLNIIDSQAYQAHIDEQ